MRDQRHLRTLLTHTLSEAVARRDPVVFNAKQAKSLSCAEMNVDLRMPYSCSRRSR